MIEALITNDRIGMIFIIIPVLVRPSEWDRYKWRNG